MNNKLRMFVFAVLILVLIIAAILTLVSAPGNPLTWLLVLLVVMLPFLHCKMTARQYVQWKDEDSVGIDSIDRQHRKLIALINSLQTAVDYSAGAGYEREALDAMVDYTKTHFS